MLTHTNNKNDNKTTDILQKNILFQLKIDVYRLLHAMPVTWSHDKPDHVTTRRADNAKINEPGSAMGNSRYSWPGAGISGTTAIFDKIQLYLG